MENHNGVFQEFGNIDIYIFDQLLKGNFKKEHKIIDIGCGNGRNLHYFLKNKFNVYGIDQNQAVIDDLRLIAQQFHPDLPQTNFQVGEISQMKFEQKSFDWVICNAVLHFAYNRVHFEKMLVEIWKLLKSGGRMIARLASNIGIEDSVEKLEDDRHRLSNGTELFLVNEKLLLDYSEKLNGRLFEHIKTTNVQSMRCMTTWCLEKL